VELIKLGSCAAAADHSERFTCWAWEVPPLLRTCVWIVFQARLIWYLSPLKYGGIKWSWLIY